jgi:[lysine-biosynthesis-protein LysW]---L-2-aminoadipate ligase
MKVGFLYSIIRKEEALIIEALKDKGITVVKIDNKKLVCDYSTNEFKDIDLVVCRDVSSSKAFYSSKFFEDLGIRVINSSNTTKICSDKFLTTSKLIEYNIPTPKIMVAFDIESAMQGIEKLGFPCVLKPTVGSHGRLITKVDNSEAAQFILEHKKTLGHYMHSIFYLQEYIEKNGKDVRAMVINGKTVGAVYRSSPNFRTNTNLGAISTPCKITKELNSIAAKAANAVQGNIVSVDLFESNGELLVNEVNAATEFKNSSIAYQTNIQEAIAEYILEELK